ncbi:MAG TPA: acyltransferase [Solirubrobacteraceae bacterium]|nr:acyltransferase [Solirubrobacteraceae bacterium]
MNEGALLEHDWFPRRVPENVELGERAWLYSSHAFLHCASRVPCAVRVGSDSGLYSGTHFELGPDAEVRIGRWCTIVGAIIATNGRVSIGDYSFLAHEVVVAGDDFARPPIAAGVVGPSPSVEIGENVWIGARAIVLGGARIGDDAIVGAGAVVRGEVPRGATAAGNPARIVRERPWRG